jgi:hypothetical protein
MPRANFLGRPTECILLAVLQRNVSQEEENSDVLLTFETNPSYVRESTMLALVFFGFSRGFVTLQYSSASTPLGAESEGEPK